MKKSTDISVVVPVKNEAGNIEGLIQEIDYSLRKFNYEIIRHEKNINFTNVHIFLQYSIYSTSKHEYIPFPDGATE